MVSEIARDKLAELVEFSVDAIVLLNADGVIQWANAATADVLGYDAADLVGVHVRDLVEPEDRAAWQALVDALIAHPSTTARGAFRCRHKDGSTCWTEGVARNLLQEPRVNGIVVYYRDVTARKATEAQLKATEDRYGHLFYSAADIIFEADAEGYFRFVNPQTLKVFGFEQDEVIGRRFTEFIRADYRPQILQHYYKQTSQRQPNSYVEFPAITKTGREVWLGQNAWIITDAAGALTGMQAVARDITERRQAEEALRTAEAKYRALVEQSLMGVYIMQDDRLVYVNPKAADLLGYTPQEMIDAPLPYRFVHALDQPMLHDQLSRLDPERMPSVQLALRGVRKDGEVIQVEAFCVVTEFGGRRAILTTVHDISDRVKLEEQLRQAQKMEAIGRLAGGIAHDFNNLLTAIRGYAELMLARGVRHDPAMAAEARRDPAGRRSRRVADAPAAGVQPQAGAAAASRSTSTTSCSGVSKMLRRLIGERRRSSRLDLARSLSQVLADPAQIEQVLLNLVVNARDAMPRGGTLVVETANVDARRRRAGDRQAGIAPGRVRADRGQR